MQNTDCSHSCSVNDNDRIRLIDLWGKQVRCKGYVCSEDGIHYKPKPEKVKLQVSIIPTDYCPASCPFCIAAKTIRNKNELDLDILEKRLIELKEMDIVRGVSITGGEPFNDVDRLNRIISMVFEILGYNTELSINTNGIGLKYLDKIKELEHVDTIHVSRHHYDDAINRKLFGIDVPTSEEFRAAVNSLDYNDIFVINCMLMKDYIGSVEEVHRFLDYAITLRVPKVSFITGAPVNPFIANQVVTFDEVLRNDDASLLFTRGYKDYKYCRCHDGIYVSPDGQLIEFYGRQTDVSTCEYARGLVLGSDGHIRSGFAGEILR